jgi:hypothetical protein
MLAGKDELGLGCEHTSDFIVNAFDCRLAEIV